MLFVLLIVRFILMLSVENYLVRRRPRTVLWSLHPAENVHSYFCSEV